MRKKRTIKLKNYKNRQQRLKSKAHNVFTEEIDKIALSSNDDKRLKSFLYPYDANVGKVQYCFSI